MRADGRTSGYSNRDSALILQMIGIVPSTEAHHHLEQYTADFKRDLQPHLTAQYDPIPTIAFVSVSFFTSSAVQAALIVLFREIKTSAAVPGFLFSGHLVQLHR